MQRELGPVVTTTQERTSAFAYLGFRVVRVAARDHDLFRCSGELDIATVAVLRDVTKACARDVVIDFTNVTSMDPGGTALLVRLCNQLLARDLDLTMVNMPTSLRRVFDVSGISDVLDAPTGARRPRRPPRQRTPRDARHLREA